MDRIEYENALGVNIEDDIICIACAENMAEESGKPILWWAINKPKEYSATYPCSYCQTVLDSEKSAEAAERLTKWWRSDIV